jgi:hypothetical protein
MTTAHIWLKHLTDEEIIKKMKHHTRQINIANGSDSEVFTPPNFAAEEYHSSLLDILYAELIERHGLEEAIALYER